ncbi:MAG TPA: helix-hairpin-helix domain-containing protein [Bacteroidota bacterium]|nr:helix-hairpin-helix domain-containing protein [Bacteroidota bacterium]
MLKRLVNWLALTRSEQRVLQFLTATLIVGAGIRWYQQTYPAEQKFDYSRIDSSFAAFRDNLATPDSTRKKQIKTGETVNINTASADELKALPGIGATLAARIVAYRDSEGEFESVEDLQNVKGISKKKLEKLKPFVAVQ